MKRIESLLVGTGIEPRPYQYRVVQKTTDMLFGRYKNGAGEIEPAVDSVMVESPTGSGKTVMALMTIAAIQSEIPDLVVGWVAMRRNLLMQVEREISKMNIAIQNFHPTSMFTRYPDQLMAAKYDSKPIMLVIDECAHDATSSCTHLHNILEPRFVLGMSATPFRTDCAKLMFSKQIKDAGIHQLIQDGYLSKYCHYSIPKWDPETVANFYCAEPARWGKSIFYFLSLEECYELHRIFQSRGVVSDVVTGGGSVEQREAQLEAFRNGAIPCLINCMVLTEGFDDPSLATTWVRDSVKGPTMQMAGRVFRQFPALQFKQVVQSKNTHWPMIRTAMPDQQFLWQENEWRTLKVNPHLEEINNTARVAIATAEVTMPKWIMDRRAKKSRRLRIR